MCRFFFSPIYCPWHDLSRCTVSTVSTLLSVSALGSFLPTPSIHKRLEYGSWIRIQILKRKMTLIQMQIYILTNKVKFNLSRSQFVFSLLCHCGRMSHCFTRLELDQVYWLRSLKIVNCRKWKFLLYVHTTHDVSLWL